MAFLRTRTASPDVPTADAVVSAGLTSAQIDGNFKSLDNAKAQTDQTMHIGTTSVTINRGTGALSLTGVSIDGNAGTATTLQNTRTINGTSFNGSVNITTANWGAERDITIGLETKAINGSAAVNYTLGEIGAAATNQTMHIGTTAVAINRGSGALALTGISSITSSSFLNLVTPNTTSANSSDITISSGNTTTSGTSGYITISSGATSGASNSGWVTITSGSTVTGTSGNILISTATSSGAGGSGNISLIAGQIKGNKTNAGVIVITGGNTSNTTQSNNGHVYISAGSPTAAEGIKYGGKVYIDGGRPAAGGTIIEEGGVLIGTQDNLGSNGTRDIRIGHANTTTTITGTVQIPTVGTSGFVKLGANGVLSADTSTYALSGHTHAAADITSGVFATARLASGTANSTTFLRGDSTWATVTSGATITNDTSTNADTFYPGLTSNQTSGAWTSAVVSSTKLYYNPSKGQLNATAFNALSDVNMKENIETIVNAVDKTLLLRGVTFNWIDTKESSIGVIAQEVEDVIPDAVSTSSKGEKSVNYGVLVGVLIEAIKELKLELNQIKSSVICQ